MPGERDRLRMDFLRDGGTGAIGLSPDLVMGGVLHGRYTKGPDLGLRTGVAHYATRALWNPSAVSGTTVIPEAVLVLSPDAVLAFHALEADRARISGDVGEVVRFSRNSRRWNIACAGQPVDLRNAEAARDGARWLRTTLKRLHAATRDRLR